MEPYQTKVLGLKLIITNPKWITVRGKRVLDVDFESLGEKLFPKVLNKKGRLTGGEIKFVRNHLGMSQDAFSKLIGLNNHSTLSRWEKKPDTFTGMQAPQEFTLRVIALQAKGYRFKKELADTFQVFKNIESVGDPVEIVA